jgi:hypothetical protein
MQVIIACADLVPAYPGHITDPEGWHNHGQAIRILEHDRAPDDFVRCLSHFFYLLPG